jgi:hypothetical protein
MKTLLLSTGLTLLLLSCTKTQNNQDQPITAVEKTIAKDLIQGAFDDLWAGVDSTKILDYHTEDFIILENGEVWDNDRIKQFMRKQLANTNRAKRINIMDFISIEKYGSSMQIAYHNKAEFYEKDSLVSIGSWLESALAIETPEGWKLKMMHSTWNGNR